MKIDCDKCGAKYSIADEKVRGKTFKIRCKKCSNVIIVRDKAAAASPGPADVDLGMPPAAQVGWHLAIQGETVGPLSEEEVRQRYASREIDKDTAVWQEGFEDWMPLGDVPVFTDLPEHGASVSHSGFGAGADGYGAGAHDDPYLPSASSSGLGMAAGAGYEAAGFSAPSSPRVSKLTGQRNENSVLFSLDNLQALATGGGAQQQGAAGPTSRAPSKGLATQAPASEGSGLIDIRALGAMVQNDRRDPTSPGAAATKRGDEPALPSFGGAGLGGLAASPLISATVEPAAAAVAAPPPARSTGPLYLMIGLLVVGMTFMGVVLYQALNKEQETIVVEKIVPGEVPSVKDAAAKAKDDEEEDDEESSEKDEGDKDEKSPEATEKTRSSSSKSSRGSSSSSSKSSDKSAPSTPVETSSSTKSSSSSSGSSDSLDVDCILNPDLAKCKSGSKSAPKPTTASAPDPNLPMQLNSTQIKAGVDPVKAQAKSCGSRYGAKPGEKVQVKLSISGSGSVISASAQGSHSGTALGSCVEGALKKAKFPKFQKDQMGALYPIVM